MQLHIVYTATEMLLTKKSYSSWREIQGEYPTYKASLGPWSEAEVLEFIEPEYPNLSPSASEQIMSFVSSPNETVELSFLPRP